MKKLNLLIMLTMIITLTSCKSTESTSSTYENVKIEEAMEINDYEVTFEKIEEYKSNSALDLVSVDEGNTMIVLTFVVENKTNEEKTFITAPFSASVEDFEIDSELLFSYKDADYFLGSISPDKKMRGYVAYEVSRDFDNLELQFKENLLTDKINGTFVINRDLVNWLEADENKDTIFEENEIISNGSTFDYDGLTFSFKDIYEYIDDTEYIPETAKEGYKFILFELDITNNRETDFISLGDPFIPSVDNIVLSDTMLMNYDDRDYFITTVPPGKTVEGYVCYEVKEDSEKIELGFTSVPYSSKAEITFTYNIKK